MDAVLKWSAPTGRGWRRRGVGDEPQQFQLAETGRGGCLLRIAIGGLPHGVQVIANKY